MPDYRLYYHNADGRYERAENISAPDDSAAIQEGRRRRHCHSLEVWCSTRKVGVVKPEGS